MTCTQIQRKLKCKFPPCPCQKCSKLRSEDNRNTNMNSTGKCCDTPPERPIPKYRFHCKCTREPEVIGPKYQRQCPSLPPPQRKQISESKGSCLEEDDCNTGKGCCNTGRNFLTFMINIIGFVAMVIISAIVFWLLVFQWTVILSFKVYHSNRNTQVAVVSVICILFLMILYSAGIKAIRRTFAKPAASKFPPTPSSPTSAPPPPAPHTTPQKASKEEAASSMFSFKWGRSKEIEKEPDIRSSWLPSYRWRTATKTTEVHSSWMSAFKWGRLKKIKKEPETRSSWMPSFSWSLSRTKEIKKEPEAHASWIPTFRWAQPTPKTETPSSWLDYMKRNKKQIETPPKTSSWVTSFTWFHSTTKSMEPPSEPQARSTWSPWTYNWGQPGVKTVKTSHIKTSSSSWIPSFIWGQSEVKKKKPIPCKTACNRSHCETKKQKVTVTITDEEAKQIFKESKLYAIPTEMKQPPTLIIYLRDLIQRNTD